MYTERLGQHLVMEELSWVHEPKENVLQQLNTMQHNHQSMSTTIVQQQNIQKTEIALTLQGSTVVLGQIAFVKLCMCSGSTDTFVYLLLN